MTILLQLFQFGVESFLRYNFFAHDTRLHYCLSSIYYNALKLRVELQMLNREKQWTIYFQIEPWIQKKRNDQIYLLQAHSQ